MSSDPNRFTITDYAYDRGADAESEVRADSGYGESEVRPYNGGQMYGSGYKHEAQGGTKGAGYGDEQITGGGSGPGVSRGPGSFSGPSGAPAASLGGNRDPTVLARPITSPTSTQTSAPPTASSSRMGSLSSASGSSRTQLKPSISARTGGTGYVPKKGKDAFPIPESVQAQMQTSPDSAGPSAAMGSHQYPPTSPPGPVGPSSSFRRLPNVPGASSPPIALGGSNGSGSLAHSTSLSSQATQSTQAAAFPTANPLQGDYLSRGQSGRNSALHMAGNGGFDSRTGQSAGFGPASPPLAMPAPSPQPFLEQPDFSRPGGTGSPGLGLRSNSASNLLSPGRIDGNGIGPGAQSPAGGFHPLPSASLSDAGSSVSRPAYPSMPSTSTEMPTLPSIGRSYRHSGVSAGTSSNWAEQGIEPAINHRGGLNGNGYDDHHDDDDGDVKEKDVDGSTKQLAFKEPAAERTWSWRKFVPGTTATRLLLFVVIFELVVDLTIEGNILYRFNVEVDTTDSTDIMNENKRRLPIYLIIFGLAHLWQLVLTVISIRTKNTIQVSAVTLFNFAFLAWAVIQVNELRDIVGSLNEQALILDGTKNKLVTLPLNILTGIIIGVVAAGCLALGVLTFFLRREFGMARYRFLGADTTIRRCYKHFQVFECVCYFSAFFCAGFGIQFVWLVLQRTDVEYIITIVALPVSILLLVFGRLAAKYENKPCMILFLFGNVCGVGYFGFKLVRIWQQAKTVYLTTSKSLTVFAALSVLTIVLLLVWGVIVFMGFGKGLKREICGKEFWRRYFRGNKGAANSQGVGAGGIDGAQAEYADGKRGGAGQRGMVQMNRLSID